MNIAIIISVSEYEDKGNNLPACAKDAELIHDLLKATHKYDEHILYLAKNTTATSVKEQVVEFINQYKGQEVEEVFFYYSGHGEFTGNEFFYLLSDYEASRRNQTALDNSELDNWLRLLNPDLTIKVVDACQAGVQYIKDPNAFKKFLAETPTSFKNCYFMYSSLKDQPSYQDRQLSYFTRSFAKAVLLFQGNQIRYKDIIDFISDHFQSIPDQTPFFVTQATNTEVFCKIDTALKNILDHHPLVSSSEVAVTTDGAISQQPKAHTLLENIKSDAERYCSEKDVLERLQKVEEFVNAHRYSDDFTDLYDVKTEFVTELGNDVPKLSELGRWLSENDNEYFAVPTTTPERYTEDVVVAKPRERYPGFSTFSTAAMLFEHGKVEYDTKTVNRVRDVIDGMELTQETPFKIVRLTATPKFENLRWHACYVTFVFSKTELRFFSIYNSFKDLNWQERKPDLSGNWQTSTCPLIDTDEILQTLKTRLDGFADYVLKPLRDKFLTDSVTKQSAPATDDQGSASAGMS